MGGGTHKTVAIRAPVEQEGAKAIGTDDENKLLRPHSESYKNLGVELSKAQISVDVFSFAPYADLATLGSCAKVTGGRVRAEGDAHSICGM